MVSKDGRRLYTKAEIKLMAFLTRGDVAMRLKECGWYKRWSTNNGLALL